MTASSRGPYGNPDALDVPVITVHCFFGCGTVLRSTTPDHVHRLMETHYDTAHRHALDRLVPTMRPQETR